MYTYLSLAKPRILTALPVSTGLVAFGWMKNSPPRKQAKNAIHDAEAHIRLSKDNLLSDGHPCIHSHIFMSMLRDNGTFCIMLVVG